MAMIELAGRDSSLVLETVDRGPPLWRHWGPRLSGGVASLPPLSAGRPPASFSLDEAVPFGLFPGFGLGWFGRPALRAHRAGRAFAHRFDLQTVDRPTADTCEVHLADPATRIAVTVRLRLDRRDVLSIETAITNMGDDLLALEWVAAAVLPIPGDCDRYRGFAGRHLDEFHPLESQLTRAGLHRENRRGITSHDAPPIGTILTPAAGLHEGVCYAAALAWSGNHVQALDWVEDGRFQWQFGEAFAPGERVLSPGETYLAPELVASCSTRGRNGLTAAFHAATRERLRWPHDGRTPRPVSLNTWEAVYFEHDLEGLKTLADVAAEIGVERFVLDDGWFKGRGDDTAGLGDWTADLVRYPAGLNPLVEHVRSRGMAFGLWVEPEMANADSDLMRARPEWALQVQGLVPPTARNQLVLDLSRREVEDYLFAALDALLSAHRIDYLKWDHNRDLAPAAGADGRATYGAQVDATYRLLGRLRAAHPEVEIESCAGGGGRIDLGVLRFTHRVWTSDNIDARSRTAIQRGFLSIFPPEIMGAHVGATVAHTTGRRQDLDFRAATALPGHFGLELDLRSTSPQPRARLAQWIGLYKALRERLHGPAVTLGEGQDGLVWQAHGPDAAGGFLVLLSQLEPPTFRHAAPLKLPMVDPSTCYRIARIDPPQPGMAPAAFEAWERPVAGDVLVQIGLPLPPLAAETCTLVSLTPSPLAVP